MSCLAIARLDFRHVEIGPHALGLELRKFFALLGGKFLADLGDEPLDHGFDFEIGYREESEVSRQKSLFRRSGFSFYLAAVNDSIQAGLAKAGVADARRHLFVCIGPDCCHSRDGEALWEFIKMRVKETGLRVMRTKAACFRICAGGPWLVVYPDGTWYGAVTPARFERILRQHLLGGEPVREWLVAQNSLAPCAGRSPK